MVGQAVTTAIFFGVYGRLLHVLQGSLPIQDADSEASLLDARTLPDGASVAPAAIGAALAMSLFSVPLEVRGCEPDGCGPNPRCGRTHSSCFFPPPLWSAVAPCEHKGLVVTCL